MKPLSQQQSNFLDGPLIACVRAQYLEPITHTYECVCVFVDQVEAKLFSLDYDVHIHTSVVGSVSCLLGVFITCSFV